MDFLEFCEELAKIDLSPIAGDIDLRYRDHGRTDDFQFCPITAVHYKRSGIAEDVVLAGGVGPALGLSHEATALIMDAADRNPEDMDDYLDWEIAFARACMDGTL